MRYTDTIYQISFWIVPYMGDVYVARAVKTTSRDFKIPYCNTKHIPNTLDMVTMI